MATSSSQTPGKRPVLHIPYSRLEVILELVTGIGIAFALILLFTNWLRIPNYIPDHFSATGIADSWGNKWSLLISPSVGIVLYIMMTFVSRFPHVFNYPWPITEDNAQKQYQIGRITLISIKAEMVWIFAYVEWQSIQVSTGKAMGLGKAFLPITILVIFGTIGVLIYKAYKER